MVSEYPQIKIVPVCVPLNQKFYPKGLLFGCFFYFAYTLWASHVPLGVRVPQVENCCFRWLTYWLMSLIIQKLLLAVQVRLWTSTRATGRPIASPHGSPSFCNLKIFKKSSIIFTASSKQKTYQSKMINFVSNGFDVWFEIHNFCNVPKYTNFLLIFSLFMHKWNKSKLQYYQQKHFLWVQ